MIGSCVVCAFLLWERHADLLARPQTLNVSNSEEADPLLHCYFKTEFVTHLMQRTNAAVQVNIGPS